MVSLVAKSLVNSWLKVMKSSPDQVKLLKNEGFIAFKSPVKDSFLNWVWSEKINDDIIPSIDKFYNGTPHCYYIDENNRDLINTATRAKLFLSGKFRQYSRDLTKELTYDISDQIEIKVCSNKQEIKQWCELFCEGYGVYTPEYIEKFIWPFFVQKAIILTIASINNNPACTGMMFMNTDYAGIFGISTLRQFRRKGLAKFTSNFLTSYAKNRGCKWIALNSTPEGEYIYRNIGFKIEAEEMIFIPEKYL